jgi:hypothetical protein
VITARPRRIVAGVAAAALGIGIWQANAGTVAPQTTVPPSLLAQISAICAHAAPGTYALPGHYCDSPATLFSTIVGESVDRIASEHQQFARSAAPDGYVPNGAMAAAITQKSSLARKGQTAQESHL